MVAPSSLQSTPKSASTPTSKRVSEQISSISSQSDLAGPWWTQPSWWQTRSRIDSLIDQYLTVEELSDRLNDLPDQLTQPTVRPWPSLPWKAIQPDQIVGLSLDTFLHILLGIINTELPIRGYSQTSRQYLTQVHPGLAYFVGGRVNEAGDLEAKGLWEREEERHGPALMRVYRQLSGIQPNPNPHHPRAYYPTTTPHNDLYRHGMHRVATEYSATCLYIWLMAHTTGPLQQVFLELVKDEVNHMVKFWGFGVWLFPRKNQAAMVRQVIGHQLLNLLPGIGRSPQSIAMHQPTTSDIQDTPVDMRFMPRMLHTLQRMQHELAWVHWSWSQRWEFFYTFIRVILRLRTWHHTLTSTYLKQLLGPTSSEPTFTP